MTSVGVFTTDRELVVRSWDAWLVDATGVSATRACGTPLVELFPDLEGRGFVQRISRVADHGSVEVLAPAFHRYLLACAPREPSEHFDRMQQHVTISPLRTGGEITGVVVTIEDVTPRLDHERELAEALQSHDEAIRLRAAQTLAETDAPSSMLAGALGDASWRVRRAAAQGMAQAGSEAAVAALVEAVRERHRDPAVLNAAVAALSAAAGALPAVIELLRVSDADVRTYAALTLGQMEDVRAVPALIQALEDDNVNVRYHAIEALGRIGARGAAEPIAAIAATRDFYLAFAALDALGAIAEPSITSALLPLLDDELLQAPTAEALARSGNEDVAVPLAQLLERDGTAVAAVASALATLYGRLEGSYGEGELVADLVRRSIGAKGAQNLLAALSSASDSELPGIVMVLGWLRAERVDGPLASMLAHPTARNAAAWALATRGPGAVDALIAALEHDDAQVRRAAASALGRIASRNAVPALIRLLDDEPDVAIAATGALGAIGDAAAFEPLIALLDHDSAAVRQAAVAALNSLGHPDLPRRTRALHGHESPRVRECAARIAGYFGYVECLEALLRLARDPDTSVRRTAVEQLGVFDDRGAVNAIDEAIRADSPDVRAAAARALGHLSTVSAVPRLLSALRDADQWVRYHAAHAAMHHRDDRLVDTLVELAEADPAPPVRISAVSALGHIGGIRAEPVLSRVARAPETEVACAALEALGRSADTRAPHALTDALGAPEAERRIAALNAIARLGCTGCEPSVATLARADDDVRIRDAAVRALGALRTEAAVDGLLSLLEDPHRARAATDALAHGGEEQVPWVARGLRSVDVGARCATVEALARMKQPSSARALASALEDPAAAVRLAAAQALGRLDLRDAEQKLGTVARTDEHPAVRRAAHVALSR